MLPRRIILCVTNDLVSDQRVHRMALSLQKLGMEVRLVGRLFGSSQPLKRQYPVHRMRLLFSKGPMFYAEYNIRLLAYLLFCRSDAIVANDLDTLPAAWLTARIKFQKLVFDSHEWFTEVPELLDRPRTKAIWQWLADFLIPRVDRALTVSPSIARELSQRHGLHFGLCRNLPHYKPEVVEIPKSEIMIIYQGAVNLGRGVELMIGAMEHLPGFRLVIAGEGDVLESCMDLAKQSAWNDRIQFLGRLPLEDLHQLTQKASVGLSLEENLGKNYTYALPNKLFDYVQARVPVVVSDLPEMGSIVREYGIGLVLTERSPKALAAAINEVLRQKSRWQEPLEKAARILCWEEEEKILESLYSFD